MLGSSVALAAAGGMNSARAENIRLGMYWWGAQERNRRTLEVGAKYHERNPSITMVGEAASADYWQNWSP